MTNLLKETYKVMERNNKHPNDISFIGSSNISKEGLRYYTSWAKFVVMADREYNAGYGGTFVALDLIIEFKDGSRMYRHEYDGSEGWVFSSPCVAPATETLIEMESPFAFCYDSISEAHREGYWNEEYHKECLCPQDGCNNLKDSWDDMCKVCYAPIRAKKEEERRKNMMNFGIKHRPMQTWNFKEMFDAEALGIKLKQALDEQQNELAQEESNTTPYLHLTNTRFHCNNHMDVFQPIIDAMKGDEEE
tara:strand:- start:8670 stop:9413 length:744 start_codon:yes stop_codon:yes gene_type:complete